MSLLENKWIRSAVPALLIHCSIGTVYCWSTFKALIAETIGMSPFAVGWAFSLAIFFLGMSAAFAGRLVERNIHFSSMLACVLFTTGMLGTGACLHFLRGVPALLGIYLFYGVIMGIGLGIGYITPVKTLMLWFSKQKGLATGISIMGFGLAKALATPVMEYLQAAAGISAMFCILGCAYFAMMLAGHRLLKKPSFWMEPETFAIPLNTHQLFSTRTFVCIWLMFFLNIHCGLALITYEKQIIGTVFAGSAALGLAVSIIPSVTAAFNAAGRIGWSTLSDHLGDRNDVYKMIFAGSFAVTAVCLASHALSAGPAPAALAALAVALLVIVNAGYGGGFSTLPALLVSRFGMEQISRIHGMALSAWAVAGLTGNNMSEILLSLSGGSFDLILAATAVLYAAAFLVCRTVSGRECYAWEDCSKIVVTR